MKRKTYKILTMLPIVGPIIKVSTNPMIYGSMCLSDEEFVKDVIKPFNEYLKKHPDIQPTRQLLEELRKQGYFKNKQE